MKEKATKKLLEGAKQQDLLIDRIKMVSPFKDLFPPQPQKVEDIAQHMKANGYDPSFPIVLWDSSNSRGPHDLIVLDGHTRVAAALAADIMVVPVVRLKFRDEQEALQYAIHNQRDRRNMTDAELAKCIAIVDKRKPQGARTDLASSEAKSGKSSEATAKIVGTSKAKVEKVRSILAKGDEQAKQEVLAGTKTINAAYNEIKGASPVLGAEPRTATYARAHFLCPYCGKKIYEDDIKLIRTPVEEQPALRVEQ